MRFLIACYSVNSNTLKVANELKALTGGDLTLIEPVKPSVGLLAKLGARLGRKAPVKPCKSDLKAYDALILCTPVCSNRPPAAVNGYVASLTGQHGKSFAVVVSSTKDDLKSTVDRLVNTLSGQGMSFVAPLEITQHQIARGEYFGMAEKLVAQFKLTSRVSTKVVGAVGTAAEKVTLVVRFAKMMGKYGKWMLK